MPLVLPTSAAAHGSQKNDGRCATNQSPFYDLVLAKATAWNT